METVDITNSGLLAIFALLAIPLWLGYFFKLGLTKETIWSIGRMSFQLFLVGFFLEYIFNLNNAWLNLAWLILMVITAVFSAIQSSKLKIKTILIPITLAFALPTFIILLYLNAFVVQIDYLFDARYLIALGGMLLGNVLGTNIVAVNSFYERLRSQNKFYLYRLGIGATQREALTPFFRQSFQLTLLPILSKTATMGIVSLPGMMTGQILGGSSPATAIRYQIAIMIAIYTASALSVLLSLLLSIKTTINGYGIIKQDIYKKHSSGG
jgi:putative ABC transport system permease protein